MQNLEQLRAASAIASADQLDRKAVNRLPALILSNGLLSTIAFCMVESDGRNRGGMKRALEITAAHLRSMNHVATTDDRLESLVRDLSGRSSVQLQEATLEALVFIGYLRRFAPDKL